VDVNNYYILLVKALGELGLLETKSKDIVPYFLRIFENEYEQNEELVQLTENDNPSTTKTNNARKKIIEVCNVFSKVRKPRSLFNSQVLYTKFLELVSNGESRMQKGGFDCILTWQEEPIIKYKQQLLGLVWFYLIYRYQMILLETL
jgi:hypothetical protein